MNKPLGSVIEGSLTGGLEVRLHPDISVEDMRVGKFLVVRGRQYDFFCLLTDVCLGTSSDRILVNPPHPEDDFLLDVLSGSGTYGTVNLSPMLMLNKFSQIPPLLASDLSLNGNGKGKKAKAENTKAVLASFEANTNMEWELLPVKTVPSHFSQVYDANENDFRSVFGW